MQNKNDEPMTDAEIYELFEQEMLEKWFRVLTGLWTAFGKSPTSETLQIYKDHLGEIPLGLLEIAIKRTIRDHKYASVPTVHDVWEGLRRELGNPHDIHQAMQDWLDRGWRSCTYLFPALSPSLSVAIETDVMR